MTGREYATLDHAIMPVWLIVGPWGIGLPTGIMSADAAQAPMIVCPAARRAVTTWPKTTAGTSR